MIRQATLQDAEAIKDIYNVYINETVITLEDTSIDTAEMTKRMEDVIMSYPFLVFEEEEQILGYAYAGKWRKRIGYKYCVENSIYLHPSAKGKRIGTMLMVKLLEELKTRDIKYVIGCITLPNPISEALHEKFNFKKVGHFPKVGYKFDQWLDVGFWQLNL